MGFLRRLLTSSGTGGARDAALPRLGSGRRLRSERAVADCLANLAAIVRGYRPTEGPYRLPYVVPGWRWNASQDQPPETVISFLDANNEVMFAAFWSDVSVTEFGVFPLGSGDERLSALAIVGHWKQRDPSLTSIGVLPGGLITLAPPRVPDHLVEEILSTAGYPSTPHNVATMGAMICNMYLQRVHQIISGVQNPGAAERFVQSHVYTGGVVEEYCQGVLDDLAAWIPSVVPYIQFIPMQVRCVPLEIANAPVESLWNELER